MHDENWRDNILGELPESFPIVECDDEFGGPGGTFESWAAACGHPQDKHTCTECGRGVSCAFRCFYDAMVASVVRELDRLGHLTPEGVRFISHFDHQDDRGPVTWCEHPDDRHGPEAGCAECRCIEPKGHPRLSLHRFQGSPQA